MIPYLDLAAQHRALRSELMAAIEGVLNTGQFVQGPPVEVFERAFAPLCSVSHAVAVNSGTSALHLALLALGIGPGDEVITAAHTFLGTAAAIRYTGARPVLVDIDPLRFTMDPAQLECAITAKTAAIIPVHMHGQSVDFDPIAEIAHRHDIPVIEDAAQAHCATYRGKRVGSLGRVACFSFYPTKNLGACGEGGAVVTDDDELAERVRAMRDWGHIETHSRERIGFNYRMESLQGAILSVKVRHLRDWTAARQQVAAVYDRFFAAAGAAGVTTPRPCPDGEHVYHHYVIQVAGRDRVRQGLERRGIGTAIHYPLPVHRQPMFADLGYPPKAFAHADRLTQTAISLPIYPGLNESAIAQVVEAVAHEAAE